MSLDHVYIVLEPVGSARLTFDDDQYYEFMSFDVPKEFGVPEWSRCKDRYIGRLYSDIGKVPSDSGIFRSIWALLGHTVIEEKGQKEGGACPPSGPNWTRGAAPFSFSLSTSFLLSYSGKERGILLGLGSPSRTPHTWRAPSRAGLSLAPLYTGAGAP